MSIYFHTLYQLVIALKIVIYMFIQKVMHSMEFFVAIFLFELSYNNCRLPYNSARHYPQLLKMWIN